MCIRDSLLPLCACMRALCQSNHSNLLLFSLQSPGLFPPQTVFPSLPPSLPHRISGKARIWQKVTTVAIFPKSTHWRVSVRKVKKCEGPLQMLAISSNGGEIETASVATFQAEWLRGSFSNQRFRWRVGLACMLSLWNWPVKRCARKSSTRHLAAT